MLLPHVLVSWSALLMHVLGCAHTLLGTSLGGVGCFKFEVASAIPPVSPRGSALRLEPLLRFTGLIFCELVFRLVLIAGEEEENVSVSVREEEDMIFKE